MVDMRVELWSRLASEIREQVLSFLSVPVLCRFRTVCKRWNLLICEPEFGALCIQNAKQSAAAGFIIARYFPSTYYSKLKGKNHGWSILDLNARRWCTIKSDEQEAFASYRFGLGVAMDGGQVCEYFLQDVWPGFRVFVSNPIAKTTKLLYPSPYFNYFPNYIPEFVLAMVVDNITNNYMIFQINGGKYGSMDMENPIELNPLVTVYESATEQWRITTNPPLLLRGELFQALCSVYFEGMLFVLFLYQPILPLTAENRLWSYNHDKDAWKEINNRVHIHSELGFHPQLIVTDNRLFLATWMCNHECFCWSFDISEIALVDSASKTLF